MLDASNSDIPPPAYPGAVGQPLHNMADSSASPSNFAATSQLQIEAMGYDTNQALVGKTLENISVYHVDSGDLEYISIRPKRSSNSCALVRGSDSKQTPLISTIYRWGPGRHPRMRILPCGTPLSVEEAIESEHVDCEIIDVRSRNMFKATQKFETSFGNFEWRYADKSEKVDADHASTLIVLERVDASATEGEISGKHGVRVAQFVRTDELRTPGTSKHIAGEGGSGGRLMINLSAWAEDKKASSRDVEAFMVASCICMLKKEADRFRDNTIAITTGV